jgi:hypothetical protein
VDGIGHIAALTWCAVDCQEQAKTFGRLSEWTRQLGTPLLAALVAAALLAASH